MILILNFLDEMLFAFLPNTVLGVVSDVIRVKKQYELAMEAALGGSIQNIVT